MKQQAEERHLVQVSLSLEQCGDEVALRKKVARQLRIPPKYVQHTRVVGRSLDARSRPPKFRVRVEHSTMPFEPEEPLSSQFRDVGNAKRIIIVGAGPAGYFAALECLLLGLKPVVIDRGFDVRSRRKDLRAIQQFGEVNLHSNYCFGEGGAGTYSDGKLYTRSHKRGNIESVLRLLVEHGANPEILVDAHPHIGSNKLPKVVANIRETIEAHGGEVHFGAHVTDLLIEKGQILGVVCNGDEVRGAAVVLATGHSARDIYELLHRKSVYIEFKPFALGVRVEHPQPLIDEIQYGQRQRHEHLPAASYQLVAQIEERGVYSFCMCPGGLIVPSATAPGELVTNGMSMSRRDSPFANSGIVTEIHEQHIPAEFGNDAFAGLRYQQAIEQCMFANNNSEKQVAPAQNLVEFIKGVSTGRTLETSYIPGLHGAPLHELLPSDISSALRQGFSEFGKKMKGFVTEEAQIVATESRTSAPIRIPRDPQTLMHVGVQHLYPCAEGAGYAGGIVSAALDGQRVVRAIASAFSTAH